MNNIENLYNNNLKVKAAATETIFQQATDKLAVIQSEQEIIIKNNSGIRNDTGLISDNQEQSNNE